MSKTHYSVLTNELISKLNINPEGIYVDCTLGLGGHTKKISEQLTSGKVIAIDQDEHALEEAKLRIGDSDNVIFVKGNFRNIDTIVKSLGFEQVDGIIYDLGTSYYQLVDEARGFTYHGESKLDMRMDVSSDFDAIDLLNTYDYDSIVKLLRDYGDEKQARKLADAIIEFRNVEKITTNTQLNEIIKSVKGFQKDKHPSKNVYQALRIEVNDEIGAIKESLEKSIDLLKVNGLLAVITFHSLEDKTIKDFYHQLKIMKTETPFETIHHYHSFKTIYPSKEEVEENRASRSAKLRVIRKQHE